ncbi:dihydrofolate reductase family protein [Saxibacter everestensis]|uniref:Dihydrofolate reductase family protein n=1 Tax=Saxibacter everestensis TaxID=2909229 RepID=A0ABY8QVI3_9MICO|nr:dihydrofolate reductase family protein [Brevibacteriaceae bacterium ZFBP1038]
MTSTPASTFNGCVFLGLSVDGFIARLDGDLAWLIERGTVAGDAGFTPFMESVDALVMGRGTYDAIADEESWPYLDRPVHVISATLSADADPRVIVHAGFDKAVAALNAAGYRRVYVDGGRTVRSFLNAGLINELTLSRVPVLIGEGITLFGPLPDDVELEHERTEVLAGGMVQTMYRVVTQEKGSNEHPA